MAAADRSVDVTSLLQAWREGDPAALEQLMPVVYGELRQLARAPAFARREPSFLVYWASLPPSPGGSLFFAEANG